MINFGASSIKQDIKSEESVQKPAANWLMAPVIALYLACLYACYSVVIELIPIAGIAWQASQMEEETRNIEGELVRDQQRLNDYEKTKVYLSEKKEWARESIGAGDLIRKVFKAIPEDVKMRGLNYQYMRVAQKVSFVVQIKGNPDFAPIQSSMRNISPTLTMINSGPNPTPKGLDLEVEYQVKFPK